MRHYLQKCNFKTHRRKNFKTYKFERTSKLLYGPGSVVGIATGYGQDGPGIPVGARFSAPVQTGLGAQSASCTMGTGSLSGVNSGRCVTLTPQPLLVPWSIKGRAMALLPLWAVRPVQNLSRAIPLLPLWTVRPVQSLSACTRVHFTFTFYKLL